MEADRGGHVDIAIRVMDLMHPPQERHLVADDMLRPDREVEDHERQRELKPSRPCKRVERSQALRPGVKRRADRSERKQQPHHDRVDDRDRPVGHPARRYGRCAVPLRRAALPYRHEREHASEDAQPQHRFPGHAHPLPSLNAVDRRLKNT